ncbi:MAG TPA: superoxide dismutase family protein [Gemmatimonas sp.]|nr:superoxide dismutase family protein [Gemmatimonas sp.]
MNAVLRATSTLACTIALFGCAGDATPGSGDSVALAESAAANAATGAGMDSANAPGAAATGGGTVSLRDAGGREFGMLTLAGATTGTGISLSGTLRGMPPGEHGIHVHTVGRCDAPGFETAGGHWNPTSRKHGTQGENGPHHGDMMNITVGADSTATVQLTTQGGTLSGADALMDADGASVVVHATADDYKTDPSGNSGARVACGVISGS